MSKEAIKAVYDDRWGRIPEEKLQLLKDGYEEIMQGEYLFIHFLLYLFYFIVACSLSTVKSLPRVLEKLGMPMEKEAIAELILWAFENKDETGKTKGAIFPKEGISLLPRTCVNNNVT